MKNFAVLGSTRGTNLSAIAEAIQHNQLPDTLQVVISNKSDAGILDRARSYGLNAQFVDSADMSREAYDQRVSALLREHNIDLIVLTGYMRILSAAFVQEWQHKILNVHPSLLPAYAGLMDMAVHEAVIAAGETETGCTVHYVTEEVDAGPIVLQMTCKVLPDDTADDLKKRVQALEGEALIQAIEKLTA